MLNHSALPQSLYVHIPFCIHKCGYCDFNSVPLKDVQIYEHYLVAMERELAFKMAEYHRTFPTGPQKPPLKTIFWGGGTPSLMPIKHTETLVKLLSNYFEWDSSCEFSMEMNPETVTPELLQQLISLGFNRFSMGIQAMNNAGLKALDRKNNREQNLKALNTLSAVSGLNWSVDLIFGYAQQSSALLETELREILEFSIKHLSAYVLTLNPKSPLNYQRPSDIVEEEMFYLIKNNLHSKGFRAYEISNYAQEETFQCQHNLAYWHFKPFFALGCGAWDFSISENEFRRRKTHPKVEHYLKKSGADFFSETINLSLKEAQSEWAITGLRTTTGLNPTTFEEIFKTPFASTFEKALHNLRQQKLFLEKNTLQNWIIPEADWFKSNEYLLHFV